MIRASLITLASLALLAGCGDSGSSTATNNPAAASTGRALTIGLLPKIKGVSYFTTCAAGAEEAARELNVTLVYDGPTDGDAAKAADLVGQWSLQGFDAIAVSANDAQILGNALEQARAKGIATVTWDADTTPTASRGFFVNQATPQQIGYALVDALAADVGEAGGEVAILSSTQTAANQNEWMRHMAERLKTHPKLTLVATEYPGEDQERCLTTAKTLLKAHPNLKGIWGISTAAFPGAAEAVRQEGKSGQVKVTGLATPNPMKPYVKDGTVNRVILWNTRDLGYLTLHTAHAAATGKLKPGATSIHAGRLGERKIEGDQVLLGEIVTFTKDNIDQFDF